MNEPNEEYKKNYCRVCRNETDVYDEEFEQFLCSGACFIVYAIREKMKEDAKDKNKD